MRGLTAERLRELLDYSQETGVLRWKVKRWRAKAGDLAGARTGRGGYLRVCIEQKSYLAHRLAWLYVYGAWPAGVIDHIDGDGSNNRISNLRQCSVAQNMQNRTARGTSLNTSGHSNISWQSDRAAWLVRVRAQGKTHFGGRFKSLKEALAARDALKASVHTFQQQFRDMQEAIEGVTERREVERLAAMLRAAA